MKTTTLLIALVALSTSAFAGPPAPMTSGPVVAEALFGPGWEFGGHALFLTPQASRDSDAWGGGVDVDYFFNAYLGLEGSAAWARPHAAGTSEANATWGNYTVDLIVRYPFEACHIAPYLIAGNGIISGRSDSNGDRVNKWLRQVGAGLEFKPVAKFSIFADWMYNFPRGDTDLPDYQEIRMGVKIGF